MGRKTEALVQEKHIHICDSVKALRKHPVSAEQWWEPE